MSGRRVLKVGTRGSALARWQTDWVAARLGEAWPGLGSGTTVFTTSGDRLLDKPLAEIGGKGVFTEELENALRAGEIDVAVHSLKDLPIDDADGLTIGAILAREDAHDILVSRDGWTLSTLPPGARVGTSSQRRSAQLLAARPDLNLLSLRGNVDTRIRKAKQGDYDAIVLAAAGVRRLGLEAHIAECLSFEVMLPAPGQGALAVQCRAKDAEVLALLAALEHPPTRLSVTAERAFLQGLGGGCSARVAAYAEFPPPPAPPPKGEGRTPSSPAPRSVPKGEGVGPPLPLPLGEGRDEGHVGTLTGLVASLDGQRLIRLSGQGEDAGALGAALAREALRQGAGELVS